jgi:hypothetical protein
MEHEGFLDIYLIWCLRREHSIWLALQMHDASDPFKLTVLSFQKFENLGE